MCVSSATVVATFGLVSSYQITKRIEKNGWKEIQQNVKIAQITDNEYFNRPMIKEELCKQLQSNNNNSFIISGRKNFGKTATIKNAFQHCNFPYISLDFHGKQLDDNDNDTFIEIFEDNMNDPKWYRRLMRRFYPNYNNYVIKRWIDSIQTLSSEMKIKNKKDIRWIILDGIDINDILRNSKLKNDINLLNQEMCDFASIIVSVTSESPIKSAKLFNKLDGWNSNIWIGQFKNRAIALEYVESKLCVFKNISENDRHCVVDFCRLNIADINYCIHRLEQNEKNEQKKTFDDIWKDIKQKRMDFYVEQQPLLHWTDVNFWKEFMNEMVGGIEISKEFELNACKYLLYSYFTSVVIVGCTAFDLTQHFGGNIEIVNLLIENGCLSQYGGELTQPFNLFNKSVLMPSSQVKYTTFQEIFNDQNNTVLSDMALFVTRHYIFNRELIRAQTDTDTIKADLEIFNVAQSYVDTQKKELNGEDRANLELDLFNKNKSFDTKLNEANRRCVYFQNAKMDNIEKSKHIVDSLKQY